MRKIIFIILFSFAFLQDINLTFSDNGNGTMVPVESNVLLEVYDISIINIIKLTKSKYREGYHSVSWNASGQASGIYLVSMSAEGFRSTQKLTLIK